LALANKADIPIIAIGVFCKAVRLEVED